MGPETARLLWQLTEPYHALVYFAPETRVIYADAGLKGGWMGYFASRAAALGPVPPGVVVATFYNFHPRMVHRAIPDAWGFSSPERVLQARYQVADLALRRLLGDSVTSRQVEEAAGLLRSATEGCDPAGRPLFAAHASLDWPTESHLVLWQGTTLLREFRGDGHVATLVAYEIDGCEAHVLAAGAGAVDGATQRTYRGWSDEEWAAAETRLQKRGLVGDTGALTEEGIALRARIEARTDELALAPFLHLGSDGCERLERCMQAIVQRIIDNGGVPFPNAMGLTRLLEG